ncbi:RRQRL motif-containing zinc-binding protein [Streptomyces agglomeratus]|uniref:RRQRL motif-containing zinc-binding protein n=1 Tax=Streptomyces agglomeratus TaxID=285458 RepID=UPI000A7DF342
MFKRLCAPSGLATKRQLRAMGLRPGGQDPVAEVETRGPKNGLLFEIAKVLPVRPMTFAKEYALDRAMAARQTCGRCGRRYHFVLPTSLSSGVKRSTPSELHQRRPQALGHRAFSPSGLGGHAFRHGSAPLVDGTVMIKRWGPPRGRPRNPLPVAGPVALPVPPPGRSTSAAVRTVDHSACGRTREEPAGHTSGRLHPAAAGDLTRRRNAGQSAP